MMRMGELSLGEIPRVVLAGGDFVEGTSSLCSRGVSILEARLDLFSKSDPDFVFSHLEKYKKLNLPLLLTARSAQEGGQWKTTEEQRKDLLLACLPFGDAVDIELDCTQINSTVATAVKEAGKMLIVSRHDFKGVPATEALRTQEAHARDLGADIVKFACQASRGEDIARFLEFISSKREQGMVGICMGAQGAISRVAAPIFGSLLSYTSLDLNYGQLAPDELVTMLRRLYPAFDEDFKNQGNIPQ